MSNSSAAAATRGIPLRPLPAPARSVPQPVAAAVSPNPVSQSSGTTAQHVANGGVVATNPPLSSPPQTTWSLVPSFLGNKLRGKKLQLLGVLTALVGIPLALVACFGQLKGNNLARTANAYSANGNALARLSYEFQLYDECHDRPELRNTFLCREAHYSFLDETGGRLQSRELDRTPRVDLSEGAESEQLEPSLEISLSRPRSSIDEFIHLLHGCSNGLKAACEDLLSWKQLLVSCFCGFSVGFQTYAVILGSTRFGLHQRIEPWEILTVSIPILILLVQPILDSGTYLHPLFLIGHFGMLYIYLLAVTFHFHKLRPRPKLKQDVSYRIARLSFRTLYMAFSAALFEETVGTRLHSVIACTPFVVFLGLIALCEYNQSKYRCATVSMEDLVETGSVDCRDKHGIHNAVAKMVDRNGSGIESNLLRRRAPKMKQADALQAV